jgi:hypothetical protein
MKFYRTGQEISLLLIQRTAWAGLTVNKMYVMTITGDV